MSTEITHNDVTPPAAPDHQCINASCGCNDLVSAGGCSEWCTGHTTELADLERGKDQVGKCGCHHQTCIQNRGAVLAGTPERGMS
jgi:hypothetical protein